MSRRPSGLSAPLAILVAVAALSGCSSSPPSSGPRADCTCAAEPVVDAALLAFLSKARAAHHQADVAEADADRTRAVAALEALLQGPRPGRGQPLAPEAAEVLADTSARLADLRSQAGQHEAALRDVEAGLSLAAAPTHFRGHLYEIQGVVLERWAKAQAAAGDAPAAARTKARAMDAFEAAIKIQDQVIDEALARKTRDAGG